MGVFKIDVGARSSEGHGDPLTAIEEAVALAEAGLPVFPARHDKRPLVKWQADATTDREQTERWWQQWPDALPCVPMGNSSGLFAVDADIDAKTGQAVGEATLEQLSIEADRHPYAVRTRSGGRHLFYRWSEGLPRNSVKRLPGVDIRGEGGYVVAWQPVVLIAARQDLVLAMPPTALLLKLRKESPSDRVSATAPNDLEIDTGARGWAASALEEETRQLRGAPRGQRNHAVNKAAFALGQIVGAGHLDRQRVGEALWAAALHNGVAAEESEATRKTITSGLDAGIAQPRGPGGVSGFGTAEIHSKTGVAKPANWPEPDPSLLRPERGAPPELPLTDVLASPWVDWIRCAAEAKGAPEDYIVAGLLPVAASLIGSTRCAGAGPGWTEPAILWSLLIGEPSTNKSPGLDAVIDPLKAVYKEVRSEAEAERADWTAQKEIADIAHTAWREQVKAAAKDNKDAPPRPAMANAGPEPHIPRLFTSDVTIERMAELLSAQPRGALLFRDEITGWLANFSRYANGGSDRPFWLEAHRGGSYSVERKSYQAHVPFLSVSVLGGIQPDKLASLLVRADDDGLTARFMPVWPAEPPIVEAQAIPDAAFAERAFRRLYALQMPVDEDGGHRPWVVPLGASARELLLELRKVARSRARGASGLVKSFIGKMPGLAVRLALVLAHLEWAAGDEPDPPGEMTADHLGRASHFVVEYLLPMAERAFSEASRPPEERLAMRIARLIATEKLEALTPRDLQRKGLGKQAEIVEALHVLINAGWVRYTPEGTTKPLQRYTVNPMVRGLS